MAVLKTALGLLAAAGAATAASTPLQAASTTATTEDVSTAETSTSDPATTTEAAQLAGSCSALVLDRKTMQYFASVAKATAQDAQRDAMANCRTNGAADGSPDCTTLHTLCSDVLCQATALTYDFARISYSTEPKLRSLAMMDVLSACSEDACSFPYAWKKDCEKGRQVCFVDFVLCGTGGLAWSNYTSDAVAMEFNATLDFVAEPTWSNTMRRTWVPNSGWPLLPIRNYTVDPPPGDVILLDLGNSGFQTTSGNMGFEANSGFTAEAGDTLEADGGVQCSPRTTVVTEFAAPLEIVTHAQSSTEQQQTQGQRRGAQWQRPTGRPIRPGRPIRY